MAEQDELKILICDMSNKQGSLLQSLLIQNQFENVIFQHDITELKQYIKSYKPNVIISGNHLWEDISGIHFIIELPIPYDTHIIIWSDIINEKIMSTVFKKNNLHFIKKTKNEKELFETIRNLKSIFH